MHKILKLYYNNKNKYPNTKRKFKESLSLCQIKIKNIKEKRIHKIYKRYKLKIQDKIRNLPTKQVSLML